MQSVVSQGPRDVAFLNYCKDWVHLSHLLEFMAALKHRIWNCRSLSLLSIMIMISSSFWILHKYDLIYLPTNSTKSNPQAGYQNRIHKKQLGNNACSGGLEEKPSSNMRMMSQLLYGKAMCPPDAEHLLFISASLLLVEIVNDRVLRWLSLMKKVWVGAVFFNLNSLVYRRSATRI